MPYTEELMPSKWENWARFAKELTSQFGITDAKYEARITLKNVKQGMRSISEYWNEFRLMATKTELDYSTAGEWLIGGMNSELQNAWGASSDIYTNILALANWGIEKETKLATVRHIQGHKTSTTAIKTNMIPRNPNRTYQPETTIQGGNTIDPHAFRRRPRLNLSPVEFRRRMGQRLCLKCAQPGHRAEVCDRQGELRQLNPWAGNG